MINLPNSHEKAQVIISSLAHGQVVSFFPYDFEFDDSYKPEWGSYEAFGRMDPIMTYKRTTRDITLSFNVVAENSGMAAINFLNLQKLIKFLYPIYEDVSSGGYSNRQKKLQEDAASLDNKVKDAYANSRAKVTQFNDALKNLNLTKEEWETAFTPEEKPELNAKIKAILEKDYNALDELTKSDKQLTDAPQQLQNELQKIKQEEQAIQAQITQLQQSADTLKSFNLGVIQKSPLFTISFMNLLNKDQFVGAITNFKHKMKFDAADSSFVNGKAIPGEFNISMTIKVLHTGIPGSGFNYST